MNDALEAGTEHLEEKLYTRACDVDTTAAIFLLKARRPEKYRENLKVDMESNFSDNDIDRLTQSFMSSLMEAANRRRLQLQSEPQPTATATATAIPPATE
jgi:hypothetical protein